MGVALTEILTAKETSVKELAGKIYAIDAFNMLYQFLTTIRMPDGTPLKDRHGNVTSHLIGLFSRSTALMADGLKLVYVFDGEAPELKREERERRKKIKDEALSQYKAAEKAEDVEGMKKFAGRAATLTGDMVTEAKALLGALGIPVVQAPSEGEAQAAHLCMKGDAYAVISQDADAFLFGAPRVIRNLNLSGRRKRANTLAYERVSPLLLSLDENLDRLGLSRERLIALAMLVGTDFNRAGIKGIGPKKALKLVQEHQDLATLFAAVAWGTHYPDLKWGRLLNAFLKMPVSDGYTLRWDAPDERKLNELLVTKHDFSEERITTALGKLDTTLHEQRGLGEFL